MDKRIIKALKESLEKTIEPLTFMEVCGTHTMEIGKLALRNFLGDKINLVSGPGCPVCVTESIYIDYLYSLALRRKVTIVTYGDMLRVPGTSPEITLEKARAQGGDIRVVYSSIDGINLAKKEPNKEFLFVAIGFETTVPSTCILLEEMINENIKNMYIISLHKKVEPVLRKLLLEEDLQLDGFILPGNVGVIIGEKGFKFLEKDFLGVVAAFKGEEILEALTLLINKALAKEKGVFNTYKSFVSEEGNLIAKDLINKFFCEKSSLWRGLGNIDKSGLNIKEEYQRFDIEKKYELEEELSTLNLGGKKYSCKCGEVLKGKIKPKECGLYKKICTPAFPVGPCMVSNEGTCAAYFKYEG